MQRISHSHSARAVHVACLHSQVLDLHDLSLEEQLIQLEIEEQRLAATVRRAASSEEERVGSHKQAA